MLGCGACAMCCTLLQVPDIGKPARMTCWWTTVHGGCARHADKKTDPALEACDQFQCVWLASQTLDDPKLRQPRRMRPDFTHVVLGPQDPDDRGLLYVQVDPNFPTAWREGEIGVYLRDIVTKGARLEVIIGDTRVEIEEPF